MTATLEQTIGLAILHVEGVLRVPLGETLSRSVDAVLRRGRRLVLLDLSRLVEIDAAGVGELLRLLKMTTAAGGVLQIMHPTRHVRHVLEVTGVLRLLTGG
jgi:anti-anti-sigma factor